MALLRMTSQAPRSVDLKGNTLDFLLMAKEDVAAVKWFFRETLKAARTQSLRVTNLDKNAAYSKAIDEMKAKSELQHSNTQNMKKLKYSFDKKLFELMFGSTLFLGMVSLGIVTLAPNVFSVRSERAHINGKIVFVRSPISGNLTLKNYDSGQFISSQEKLGNVNNLRADSTNSLILKREELKSQISISEKELESLTQQQQYCQRLIEEISIYVDYQSHTAGQQQQLGKRKTVFEIERLERKVNQAKAVLRRKIEEKTIAEKEAQRFKELANEGVIAAHDADKSRSTVNQSQEDINEASEQYQEAILELRTSKSGLSSEQVDYLGKMRETQGRQQQLVIQRQQLLTKKINLADQKTKVQSQIQAAESEIRQIETRLQTNTSADIQSPINGPIWSVLAQPHENVQAHDPIVGIVDCKKRWIEALFSEVNADYLHPGLPVKANILGPIKQTLKGRIEASRAGLGRMSPGEDIVDYTGEVPRNRIALRISVEWPKDNNYQEYCYVGRSVEVVVPRFFR